MTEARSEFEMNEDDVSSLDAKANKEEEVRVVETKSEEDEIGVVEAKPGLATRIEELVQVWYTKGASHATSNDLAHLRPPASSRSLYTLNVPQSVAHLICVPQVPQMWHKMWHNSIYILSTNHSKSQKSIILTVRKSQK